MAIDYKVVAKGQPVFSEEKQYIFLLTGKATIS